MKTNGHSCLHSRIRLRALSFALGSVVSHFFISKENKTKQPFVSHVTFVLVFCVALVFVFALSVGSTMRSHLISFLANMCLGEGCQTLSTWLIFVDVAIAAAAVC